MIVPTCCQVESGKADPFNAWCASYCASDLQVDTLKVKEYYNNIYTYIIGIIFLTLWDHPFTCHGESYLISELPGYDPEIHRDGRTRGDEDLRARLLSKNKREQVLDLEAIMKEPLHAFLPCALFPLVHASAIFALFCRELRAFLEHLNYISNSLPLQVAVMCPT